MIIDAKLNEGYVVLCVGSGTWHSFLVQNLGVSVECPQCGRTALSVKLAEDFAAMHDSKKCLAL